MSIEELNKLASKLIEKFVDQLGLDGKAYIKAEKEPQVFYQAESIFGVTGGYVYPKDTYRINKIIEQNKLTKEQIEDIRNRGYILITKNISDKRQLLTLIHERFHAYRNTLLHDAKEHNYLIDNGNYVLTSDEYSDYDADLNQDIMKGSFDTSRNTINKYEEKNPNEIESIQFQYAENDEVFIYNKNVDETLVELMAILSYKLNKYPDIPIKTQLETLSSMKTDGEDFQFVRLVTMSRIILKHNDYDLFKWMIDPIEYSYGDPHYDFFKNYTKNDGEYTDIFKWDPIDYLRDSKEGKSHSFK